ncbi:type 1 glutamine amidotransferase domain-containing protein [Nitriliruptor alkaliphilus]|uniref:type 1 glutamine amidotransferase domain-containing protein n=1 Tax=Nitriliruptor alkaliphilus TaxID=427918 RepID=UPI000695C893|nr:type 1 glutamine amidotransferase domain-containing protein [Nitriliruptor alkaliphilus]
MATVAFLVAHEGIEQVELTQPWRDVRDAGATPVLLSTTDGEVQGFDHLEPADTFEVDHEVSAVSVDDFDLVVLPGGVANPDVLRMDEDAVAFVKAAIDGGTPVAAICHAPWMLVEADAVRGRTVTSWPSLRTDLRNAGATWVDEELVVDREGPGALITSRKPDDLEAFGKAVVAELEGR